MRKNKNLINAWCSYDIANSAYNLIITATIFPIYYHESTTRSFPNGIINILGINISNTVIYDFCYAIAYFVIILISPMLAGIADTAGYKKLFMRLFTYAGAIACILLFYFDGYNLFYGLFFVSIAVIGYSGSLVFYNSFLPIISEPEEHDYVSAKGFSWGYAGSVVFLIAALFLIMNYHKIGFNSEIKAMQYVFVGVGIWWFGIAHIALFYLKEPIKKNYLNKDSIVKGYYEIIKVFKIIKLQKHLAKFLLSFFLYSTGVQTILLVATLFGKEELKISGQQLIIVIITLQVLGIIGSYFFSYVSSKKGNHFSIISMLLGWLFICIYGIFIRSITDFYIVASILGLLMGGIQSQSRSSYSKMIYSYNFDTASFFSFYDITEKMAIVVGMFLFGIVTHMSGNMRHSIAMLLIFFLLSLIIFLIYKPLKKINPS